MTKPRTVLVVAGESSGDAHTARLIQKLKAHNISWFGIGGDKMQALGVELLQHIRDMSVMGFFEVFKKYRFFLKVMKQLKTAITIRKPDLVLLVDYPSFNLKIAKFAKTKGIKVIYFIAPKIWATRAYRIKNIQKYVNHMAVIFPFEVPIYQKAGVKVSYVGNPLAGEVACEMDKISARKYILESKSKAKVIGLFPGSRLSETNRLLPILLDAADIISKQIIGVRFILPVAEHLDWDEISGLTDNSNLDISLVKQDDIYPAIKACDVVVAVSGTVNLEIGLLAVPLVVIHQISAANYFFVKFMLNVENISLVNIIAEKKIVNELLQDNCTANNIAKEVLSLIADKAKRKTMLDEMDKLKQLLGDEDTAGKMAEIVLLELGNA